MAASQAGRAHRTDAAKPSRGASQTLISCGANGTRGSAGTNRTLSLRRRAPWSVWSPRNPFWLMTRCFRLSAVALLVCVQSLGATEIYHPSPDFSARFCASNGYCTGLAAGPDGSLVVWGSFVGVGTSGSANLALISPDGAASPVRFPSIDGSIGTAAMLADGKLIVGGMFSTVGSANRQSLARLNPDGTLDTAFAPDLGTNAGVSVVVPLPHGQVLVGGSFTAPAATGHPNLVRLNADGSVDASFAPTTLVNWAVRAATVAADGRIIVSGGSVDGSIALAIARLEADGSRDATFTSPFQAGAQADRLIPLPDGKILVAGSLVRNGGSSYEWLYRLMNDGTIDPTFGGTGRLDGPVKSLSVYPNGDLLVGGSFSTFDGQPCRPLIRLKSDGHLDTEFVSTSNVSSIVSTAIPPDGAVWIGSLGGIWRIDGQGAVINNSLQPLLTSAMVSSAVRLPDGSWLAAGTFTLVNGVARPGLARVTSSGEVDASFSPPTDLGLRDMVVAAASDGKVFVAGTPNSYGPATRYVFRLNPDGSRDAGFETSGIPLAYIGSMQEQAPGKLLVAGSFDGTSGAPRNYIARLDTNGQIDSTFFTPSVTRGIGQMRVLPDRRVLILHGTSSAAAVLTENGAVDTSFQCAATDNDIRAIEPMPSGQWMISGSFYNVSGVSRPFMARLASNGSLDPTFAPAFTDLVQGRIDHFGIMDDGSIWAVGYSPDAFRIAAGTSAVIPVNLGGNRTSIVQVSASGSNGMPMLVGNWSSADDAIAGGMVVLEPASPPVIDVQPGTVTAEPGEDVTLTVSATGGSLTYQWYKDDVPLAGATASSLTLENVQWTDAGNYTVAVSNRYFTVTSSAGAIAGPRPAPSISAQPQTLAARVGAAASLSVAASAAGTPRYQWRRNGTEIPGANSPTLPFAELQFSDAAFYDVVVIDGLAATISSLAEVRVYPGPFAGAYEARADLVPRLEKEGGAIYAALAAPDGSMLVAGAFSSLGSAPTAKIARFLPDGSPDPSFAPVTIDGGAIHAIALQPDGKIVAGGSFTRVDGADVGHLTRLLANGAVDPDFAADLEMQAPQEFGPPVSAVAVQADGKIWVGGALTHADATSHRYLVRLLPSGAVDNEFEGTTAINGRVNALLALPDGSLMVGGEFKSQLYPAQGYILRLSSEGAVDRTFAPGSAATSPVVALARLSDGSILAAESYAPGLLRLSEDGGVYPGFIAPFQSGTTVTAMSAATDDRVFVGGELYPWDSSTRTQVVELTATGTVVADRFTATIPYSSKVSALAPGPAGTVFAAIVTNDMGVQYHRWLHLAPTKGGGALQSEPGLKPGTVLTIRAMSEQRWALGGDFDYVNGVRRSGLAAMRADGSADLEFCAGSGTNGPVTSIDLDGAGRLLVAGSFLTYDEISSPGLVRVLPNGARDPSFTPPTGLTSGTPPTLVRSLPDGDIVLAGSFSWVANASRFSPLRLAPDGTLRSSYPPAGVTGGGIADAIVSSDGHLLITGTFTKIGTASATHLGELLPDGARDASFELTVSGNGTDLTVDPSGRVVVGTNAELRRLLPNGSWDSSFDGTGRRGYALITDIDGAVLHADGPLVAGPLLGRVTDAGTGDTQFSIAGTLKTADVPGVVSALAPGLNGWVLLGGSGLSAEGTPNTGLLLLQPAILPSITSAPVSRTATAGSLVVFSVEATGPDLQYQWFHDGKPVPGATAATLTLTSVSSRNVGFYVVRISNEFGSVDSSPALLGGPDPAPTITAQPAPTTVSSGSTLSLMITATGVAPLSYQWRRNRVPIEGARAPALAISPVSQADTGSYDCLVASGLSQTASGSAWVTVTPPAVSGMLEADPESLARFESNGAIIQTFGVLPDGMYYAAGSLSGVDDVNVTGIARFHPDGTLDPTFAPPPVAGEILAILVQTDGKVVIGGDFVITSGARPRHVARLCADGSVDPTFSSGTGFNAPVRALATDNSRRIVAGGDFTTYNGSPAQYFAVLHETGVLDSTFDGHAAFDGPVLSIAVRPADAGFVVSGGFEHFKTVERKAFAWVSPHGTLGSTSAMLYSPAEMMVFLADGRLLVAGRQVGFACMQGDGSLDYTIYPEAGVLDGSPTSFALQSDGRILVGCESPDRGTQIARLQPTGGLDSTFEPAVIGQGRAARLAVLPDGTVLCGESMDSAGRLSPRGIRRYTSAGLESKANRHAMYRPGLVLAIEPADNGWWLVGGRFDRINDVPAHNIARISESGTVDGLFQTGTGFDKEVEALLPLSDGSVLVGGGFGTYDGESAPALVRLTWNGTRDRGFRFENTGERRVHCIALRQDTTILAVVSHRTLDNTRMSDVVVVDENGTATPLTTGSFVFEAGPSGLHVLPGGDLLIGGKMPSTLFNQGIGAARLSSTGGGVQPFLNDPSAFDAITSFAPAPNSGFYMAGDFGLQPEGQSPSYTRIERRDATGKHVSSFVPGTGFDSLVRGIAAQSNGTILAWGSFRSYNGSTLPGIGMLSETGALDADFGIADLVYAGDVRRARVTDSGQLMLAGGTFGFSGGVAYGLCLVGAPTPSITRQPSLSSPAVAGSALTLSAEGSGPGGGAVTYQWQYYAPGGATAMLSTDGVHATSSTGYVDIAGATSATFSIAMVQRQHLGYYRVVVTSGGRSRASNPVYVAPVTPPSSGSRLLNLSTRARCLDGDNILIPGFVIEGGGTRRLLLRAVGPHLGEAGIQNPLPDPRLLLKRLVNGRFEDFAANDNWGDDGDPAAIALVSEHVGAFALHEGSLDAALLLDLPAGLYTAFGYDVGARSGIALVEIYDADDASSGARLVNLSNRGYIGVGDDVMIPGFVVSNEGPRTFLIRVVGPSLQAAGVKDPLTDPVMNLYRYVSEARPSELLLTNDDWERSPDALTTEAVARNVGAFALQPGGTDAACVVTLPPGVYTVVGSGSNQATGVALVEVYLVP